jgi:hypothetical protein
MRAVDAAHHAPTFTHIAATTALLRMSGRRTAVVIPVWRWGFGTRSRAAFDFKYLKFLALTA